MSKPKRRNTGGPSRFSKGSNSTRKSRLVEKYLDELELFRRLVQEDIRPKRGSAAEIRCRITRGRLGSLRFILRRLEQWQEIVRGQEIERAITFAKAWKLKSLFLNAPTYYPRLYSLHADYMQKTCGVVSFP
jgi:hypothetical protein